MATFGTLIRCTRYAWNGHTMRDKRLAFLLAGLVGMGHYRRRLRQAWIRQIDGFGSDGYVRLAIRRDARRIVCDLRCKNEADYLVAGEMVMGGYALPHEVKARPTAIVDGGANIGVFALQASARFPDLPITCYEPDTANIAQLRRNLNENRIVAEIVSKALWSRSAELFFHPGESYTGFVSSDPSSFPISCLLPPVPDGCWLKLDIEGAEYEVLPALLSQNAKPAIISMEIHDYARRGESLLNLLRQHGYSIFGSFKSDALCVTVCAYKPF